MDLLNLFTSAAGYYRPLSIDIPVLPERIHGHDAGIITGVDVEERVTSLRAHYLASHGSTMRDLAHMMTGITGGTPGRAFACAVGGDPDKAYAVARDVSNQMNFDGRGLTPALAWSHEGTWTSIAHEIGHVLAGHHTDSNCVEAIDRWRPAPDAFFVGCTIMFPDVTSISKFSTASTLQIRGYVEAADL